MANARRTRGQDNNSSGNGINPWLGYTDMLSSTLLIVLLAMGLAALTKGLNEKPPLIQLTETESFRFPTAHYALSREFRAALDEKYSEEIKSTIQEFGVNVIEVVGHTDGQPNPRWATSNLDRRLQAVGPQQEFTGFRSGSNADLGLLRAMAVSRYLQALLEQDQLDVRIRPYSASSLLDPQGNFNPAPTVSDARRRRIELRFTRN